MNDINNSLLFLVDDVLGPHRPTSKDNPQKYFNCKSSVCIRDHNKYNLSYNSEMRQFHCFKCGTGGSINRLVGLYGKDGHQERLKMILPYSFPNRNYFEKTVDHDNITCDLPNDYIPLIKHRDGFKYKQALDYVVNKRKITLDQIDEYNIGYTEKGDYKLRIIIPSYNNNGRLNYFEARAYWDKIKMTYLKPKNPDKNDIIFFENRINWDLPVYLVEGVFDAFRIPNSIPMLGKIPSYYLITKLLEHKSRVVLVLDEDAIKDSYKIFEDLTSLGLDMYFIDMSGKDDISRIFEKEGKSSIIKLLKTVKKIDFTEHFMKLFKYVQ